MVDDAKRAAMAHKPGDRRDDALTALSEACLRYGRTLAGLPDLRRAQVRPAAVPTPEREEG